MAKRSQSIEKTVLDRIYGHGRGWVFTPRDFLDLGNAKTIGSALKRQKEVGRIRQLGRGVYDYPVRHPKLGLLSPKAEFVARALAGRDHARLQPAGAYAANLLGLSEQVPARVVFLTDGPSRLFRVGRQTIELRRTTPRNMATANRVSGLVIQALRHIGEKNITSQRIEHLRRTLSNDDRKTLVKDIKFAPMWMHAILRDLSEGVQ